VLSSEDGTFALEVANRVNNYDGIDILKDALMVADTYLYGLYAFVATGPPRPAQAWSVA